MPDDIPAHFKLYNIFMRCPRQLGKVTLKGGDIQVEMSRWDFGKIPAASALHAVNTIWDRIPHDGPALLDAAGNPVRKRKIRKSDICVEEAADAP